MPDTMMSIELTIINDMDLAFKKLSLREDRERERKKSLKTSNTFLLREYEKRNYLCGWYYFRSEN